MKKQPLPYLLLSLIIGMLSFSACDDIIEPSISKSQVKLQAPANKDTSASYTINFWWNTVDHALSYHLQVVTPTFASPLSLVLDTVVTTYKFSATLNPGSYQWRVLAQNGSSQTAYSAPNGFIVVPSSITKQSVLLFSPANNFFTNQAALIFQWGSIYGASQYSFQIDTNNFANPNAIVSSTVIPGTQTSFTFPKAQTYQWRVQARNDTAQAQWSAVNTITFNNTPPAQVTLVAPANGLTESQPVALKWNPVTNAAHYKLYVLKSDSATAYNSNFPMAVNGTSYSFNQGISGDHVYWKVSAVDAEGNEGKASALNNFILQ